jgi:hypothetical protein
LYSSRLHTFAVLSPSLSLFVRRWCTPAHIRVECNKSEWPACIHGCATPSHYPLHIRVCEGACRVFGVHVYCLLDGFNASYVARVCVCLSC